MVTIDILKLLVLVNFFFIVLLVLSVGTTQISNGPRPTRCNVLLCNPQHPCAYVHSINLHPIASLVPKRSVCTQKSCATFPTLALARFVLSFLLENGFRDKMEWFGEMEEKQKQSMLRRCEDETIEEE